MQSLLFILSLSLLLPVLSKDGKLEARNDSALDTARAFVETVFSSASPLNEAGPFLAPQAPFAQALALRQQLIRQRYQAFQLTFETHTSLLWQGVAEAGNLARVHLVLAERSRLNGRTGISHIAYDLLLEKVTDDWKIRWATSDDFYSSLVEESVDDLLPDAAFWSLGSFYADRVSLVWDGLCQDAEGLQQMVDLADRFPYKREERVLRFEKENLGREKKDNSDREDPERTESLVPESTALSLAQIRRLNYQKRWALSRNPRWDDYSLWGDCQNYASQVLHAGGSPQSEEDWYYRDAEDRGPAWTGVYWMQLFLAEEGEQGPRADWNRGTEDLETGDFIYLDSTADGADNHVLVFFLRDDQGLVRVSGHSPNLLNEPLNRFPGRKTGVHLLDGSP